MTDLYPQGEEKIGKHHPGIGQPNPETSLAAHANGAIDVGGPTGLALAWFLTTTIARTQALVGARGVMPSRA